MAPGNRRSPVNMKIKSFVRDEAGVTAVEYSVLAVLIISAIVLATTAFSTALTSAFTAIGTKLSGIG